MGFAIADKLALSGANVILISGPVNLQTAHPNIKRIDVVSAEEMYQKAIEYFPKSNGAVMCAAVADYRPAKQEKQKIKRNSDIFSLELVPNPDIAAYLGKTKNENQILAGFALETSNEIENAFLKLKKKNLDFIVLNSLNDAGAGFQTDTNKVTILDRNNKTTNFELKYKREVASDIVNYIIQTLKD